MKLSVLMLIICIFLIIQLQLVSAEECEYQEIHECREVSNKTHAFNGQIDMDCVERGIYEICTAFEYLGVEGSCYVDADDIAKCSCTPDVKLFCSTDKLAIVTSNADCTTRNDLCGESFYCTENSDPPYNPKCGYSRQPPANDGSGGGGGGGGGGSSGGGDFPSSDGSSNIESEDEEPVGTITDLIEDLTSITETISKPENMPYVITIVVVVIIAIAGTVYYFKKVRKRKYKGY